MKPAFGLLCVLAAGLGAQAEGAGGAASAPRHRHIRHPKAAVQTSQQPLLSEQAPPASEALPGASAASATSEGYPQLPAVSAMLGSASETMKSITSQASVLEARVAQKQLENEAKMARQKAVFEQKLKFQEDRNRGLHAENERISGEIAALRRNGSALREHAKELQDSNHLMRTELRTLQSKFSTALDFLTSSLKSSDDSNAPELAVLQPAKAPKRKMRHRHAYIEYGHRHEDKKDKAEKGSNDDQDEDDEGADDSDADEDDDGADGAAASLLAMASRVRRTGASRGAEEEFQMPDAEATPRDLLDVLSKGVTELHAQERESEAKLKAMFLESFKAGTRRHASLVSEQTSLNATRSSLLTLQAELLRAEAHLEATEEGLKRRLRGLGLFVQRLGHLALAPTSEASRLLKTLPEDISATDTKKE